HGSKHQVLISQQCGFQNFNCGPTYNGALHWDLSGLPSNARFQSVTVRLATATSGVNDIDLTRPALWMAQKHWAACQISTPGPPFNELSGFLATAVAETPTLAVFRSDRLGALLEAQMRGRTLVYGTLIRANDIISFQSTLAPDVAGRPSAVVRF